MHFNAVASRETIGLGKIIPINKLKSACKTETGYSPTFFQGIRCALSPLMYRGLSFNFFPLNYFLTLRVLCRT